MKALVMNEAVVTMYNMIVDDSDKVDFIDALISMANGSLVDYELYSDQVQTALEYVTNTTNLGKLFVEVKDD